MVTYVLMTKRQLDKYIELLDNRIEYLKSKRQSQEDNIEFDLLLSMRNHAFDAYDSFT